MPLMSTPLPRLPADLDRPFAGTEASYGRVYGLARALLEQLDGAAGPVCLASTDRALTAAGLLCSLAGGPELVLPHDTSAAVLAEARAVTGFTVLLGDDGPAQLSGVTRLGVPESTVVADPPDLIRQSEKPFLALFTGGSTGRPQVWTKTPANLLGEAGHQAERFGIAPEDVFLSCVPPQHIYGLLFSVLLPLIRGAQVLPASAYLPAEIAGLIQSAGPTVFVSGPAHYRALRETALEAPRLRIALSSGGMLDEADSLRFSRQTGIGVTEVYGSTETGGIATRCRAAGEVDWTPLSGVRWAITGERLQVASDFLSPELERDAAGLFTTGDRAEPRPDGRFALLGRADGIVKVAGKRVDLLEVEQKLASLDGVDDAHVLAHDSQGRGSEVIALVVGTRPEAEIRAALALELPAQALPRRLLVVEAIPTAATGKRDKRAIEALVQSLTA